MECILKLIYVSQIWIKKSNIVFIPKFTVYHLPKFAYYYNLQLFMWIFYLLLKTISSLVMAKYLLNCIIINS